MPASCAAIFLGAAFYTGIGPINGDSVSSHLTDHEVCITPAVTERFRACADQTCRDDLVAKQLAIVALRREMRTVTRSQHLFDRLRMLCDRQPDDLDAQLHCFEALQGISFEGAMALVGYTPAGVTMDGYSQIRIGMTMNEVDYILGDYGEELSYASSGGYSVATYAWRTGRRSIIVTFEDDKVAGRAQAGL